MFKIGDKCILKDTSKGAIFGFTKGDKVTIRDIGTRFGYYKIQIYNGFVHGYVDKDQLELIKEDKELMKLKDLKNGDILTLRNGEKVIYIESEDTFYDLSEDNENTLCETDDLEEDLTCYYNNDYNVVKIERPEKYETIYVRETKKMTMTEICQELGYDVEIVKEEI